MFPKTITSNYIYLDISQWKHIDSTEIYIDKPAQTKNVKGQRKKRTDWDYITDHTSQWTWARVNRQAVTSGINQLW